MHASTAPEISEALGGARILNGDVFFDPQAVIQDLVVTSSPEKPFRVWGSIGKAIIDQQYFDGL